jgi:polar amino acid transport system substrate-binding protein
MSSQHRLCRRAFILACATSAAGLALAPVVLAPVVAATPANAQSASSMAEIKTRGSLRVGVTQAPPWYFKSPGASDWSGLGVSVGKAMAQALGVTFEPVEVTWGTAIAALQSNKIDIMFVLDATPERALAVDFPSQPLLYYALAVLTKDEMSVVNWSDLDKEGVRVAVPQGTTMDVFATKNLPKATILRFPSNGEAVAAFQSGRADVVSLFHPPLISMRQQLGYGKIVVPKPIRASASSAAVRLEPDKTWRDWVGTAIGYYYITGETQAWYEQFLTQFGLNPKSVPAIQRESW